MQAFQWYMTFVNPIWSFFILVKFEGGKISEVAYSVFRFSAIPGACGASSRLCRTRLDGVVGQGPAFRRGRRLAPGGSETAG